MFVCNYQKAERVQQAPGALQSSVIGPKVGAKNIVSLMWELDPGVSRPTHAHANEHGAIVLAGTGILSNGKEKRQLVEGDVFFLSSQEPHEMTNNGNTVFRYIFFNPVTH